MKYWIVPSNAEKFNLDKLLKDHDTVSWRSMNKFEVDDVVFIYTSSPVMRITYKMVVAKINVSKPDFDETPYWGEKYQKIKKGKFSRSIFQLEYAISENNDLTYKSLVAHGLKGVIQSNRTVSGPLLQHIIDAAEKNKKPSEITLEASPDYIPDTANLYEGAVMQVNINKYERNREAREKCLAEKGYKCAVCGLEFEKVYGDIGRGFIHVHHTVPISTIGKSYVIDPIEDLVPVCPNCHAMLHKGKDGSVLTVDELKSLMKHGT